MKVTSLRRHFGYLYQVPHCAAAQPSLQLSLLVCRLMKMSPAKKSMKTIALPIAKLGFTSVPPLEGNSSSYRSWLKVLWRSKSNQKLLLKHEKDVLDQCFRQQAMQQFALDNNKLKQALAGVRKPSLTPALLTH